MMQDEQFRFVFKTRFDVGETVHFPMYSAKSFPPPYGEGTIQRIIISKAADGSYGIKYDINYLCEEEHRTAGIWEDDLVRYECTYGALPKLMQVVLD